MSTTVNITEESYSVTVGDDGDITARLLAVTYVGVPAGGTTGQVLTKDTGTDYDVSWAAPGGITDLSQLPQDGATTGQVIKWSGTEWEAADDSGSGGGAVDSVFGRTGDVVAAADDYTWAQIDKTTSSLADITTKSHTALTDKGTNTHAQIDTHLGSTANPHSVTKTQVGLGSVPNLDTTNAVANEHTHSNSAELAAITDAGSGVIISSAERTKLSGIEEGAEVNVNADWNSSSGDSEILNKPTIPTVSDVAYDSGTWDNNTDAASKNAIRDKIETLADASHNHDAAYAPIAEGVTNGDSHDHSGGDGAQIDHTTLSNIGTNAHSVIDTHLASTANPHSVDEGDILPSQTGNSGKYLTTNGSVSSWDTPSAEIDISGLTEQTPGSTDWMLWENNAGTTQYKVAVGDLPGGGGGEANTASSQGTGTSIYYTKSGVDLQFNALKSENDRLSVSLDSGTHDVEFTVNEGNIVHQNVSGAGTNTHAQIDTHLGSTSNPHSVTASQVSAYATTDFISTSAGAGDSGKPLVLDAGGHVDATMINDADIDHANIANKGTNTHAQIDTHLGSTSNPHSVTIGQIGAASDSHNHDATYAAIANGVTNGDSHDHSGGDGAQIDHTTLSNIGTNAHSVIDTHLAVTDGNPHGVDEVDILPAQATHSGKYLTTNGSATSWNAITASDISDFDTEVGNHTDVAANTAARHTQAHTMTSTSDHDAGSDKVFYSDGFGDVQEVTLGTSGTYLKSNGTGSAPSWDTPTGGGAHASDHITGGSDEIDGDKLDIDWTPTNYVPSTTPTEVDSLDNLTAHLYGIDQKLHTRLHGMTSGNDHSANNWKVFYSNGSGWVTELALGADGTYLRSNGAASAPTFDTPSGGTAHNILSATHSDTTGGGSEAQGDLLVRNGSSQWTSLAVGSSGQVLHGGTDPSYSAVSLTADVSGTLPVANGGTNATSYTNSQLIRMNSGGTAFESSGKTAPSGDILGTTDTQTVTNKDLTDDTNLLRLRGGCVFENPEVGDVMPLMFISNSNGATIREVAAGRIGGTSVTFNVEKRASVGTAGTDAFASDEVVTTDEEWTSFSSASCSDGDWLVATVSAVSGSVTMFVVNIEVSEASS